MPNGLLVEGIGAVLKALGPYILNRVARSIDEADGKFTSDWRRARYVRRDLRRALRDEIRLVKVPRSVQRFLVEYLIIKRKQEAGDPLAGIKIAGTAGVVDPTDSAGA